MFRQQNNRLKAAWILGFVLMTNLAGAQKIIQVGKKGFATVQAALNSIGSGSRDSFEIRIAPGIYSEVITVDATKPPISLKGMGQSPQETVIRFNNHAGTRLPNGDTLNTWTCATAVVYANAFRAENLSFVNDAGFTAGQAVALRVEGNRAAFYNCRFTGFQDVLFLSGSGVKQYFEDCYIEGTTDFIFGAATALFNSCHIHSKKNSHVTAASTNTIIPYGFVFLNCRLTADSNLSKVSLGRPWQPAASVTYINCYLGSHITKDGWHNWNNPANEKTARFAEYGSYGPGASGTRLSWVKNEKTIPANLQLNRILGDWQPQRKPLMVTEINIR